MTKQSLHKENLTTHTSLSFKLKSLFFILLLLSKKQRKATYETVPLDLKYEYSLKRLVSKAKRQEALLIFHSLNGKGNEDPRVQHIATVASHIGFDVYLPNLTETANYHIKSDAVERRIYFLQECYHYLKKPFSIIAPSYDGTMCLEALSHDKMTPMVKSICCIGSSHAFYEVLSSAIHDKLYNPFCLVVALNTFLAETGQLTPNLSKILALLADNQPHSPYAIVPEGMELTDHEKYWVENALNQERVREVCHNSDKYDSFKWHLEERLHLISTPVSIVHGRHDHIIPVASAFELDRKLTGCPHKMATTHFLGHGDIQVSMAALKDMRDLINVMAFFLQNAFNPSPLNRR